MQLFIFDHYMKKLQTVLTENEVISATETKEINKAGTLDLQLPLKYYDVKETDMLLVHTGYENKYHVYRVIQRSVENEILTIKANEYAYHLFLADGIVHDKRPNNKTVRQVIEQDILEFMGGWEVGYVDDDLPRFTGNFYRENRLSCLTKIKEACNVEFDFVFIVENNQIKHRYIECYDELGVETGKRFEYGDNLLSIVAETDASEVYTRAYGFGKGEETENGGWGRKIDMTGVEWRREWGNPVDKPADWDFILDTNGNWKDYQLDNETDPSTVFEFSDCEDKNELVQLTWDALQQVNRPKVQFKAQVAYAGDLNLGDRINIVRSDINVRYKTRVFKVVRDLINPALSTLDLGDKVGTTTGEMIDSITNQINGVNNQITNIKNNISIIENNTGNHIFYGPDEPQNKVKGDTWFQEIDAPNGGKQIVIKVWDGERWKETYSDEIIEELRNAIDVAKEQTQEALDRADEAIQKGEDLENSFGSAILDITDKVDNAVTEIQENKAETDKKIEDAVKDFENKNNATSEKVDNAIKDFEENKNDLNNKITEVDKKADGIQTTVKDLEVNTESKFTQLDSVIQSKVNKDEFEASQTITNEKIEQVVKDNTANSEKISSLTQTAEGIQASVSDLEKETNSKLTILDDAIQQKVSKDDFETTKNQLSDEITQTVKKIDNIKIGAVNLISNSNPMPKLTTYPNNTESETRVEWQRFNVDDVREQEILPKDNIFMKLDEDVSFIQQVTVKTDGELKRAVFSLYSYENGHDYKEATIKKLYDNAYMIYVVVNGNGKEVRLIDITTIEIDGGTFVEFQHPQLERGTVPSDWSPNPSDLPSAEKVSQISQKADSIELSVKDLKENTESRLNILDGAIQSKVSKDDYEASQTIVNNQITQIVKDTTANAEKISQVDQKADGIQIKVDDLEKDTSSKITILDDLIKSTVKKIGVQYPNGKMDDADVSKYYEVRNGNEEAVKIGETKAVEYFEFEANKNSPSEAVRKDFDYVNLIDGDVLTIETEAYIEETSKGRMVVIVNFFDKDDKELQYVVTESDKRFGNWQHWTWGASEITSKSQEWTKKTTEFTAPKDAVKARVGLRCEGYKEQNVKGRFKTANLGVWTSKLRSDYVFVNSLRVKDKSIEEYKISNIVREAGAGNENGNALLLTKGVVSANTTATLKEKISIDENEELIIKFMSKTKYTQIKNMNVRLRAVFNSDDLPTGSVFSNIKHDVPNVWINNEINYGKPPKGTKYVTFSWMLENSNDGDELAIDNVTLINGADSLSSSITQLADDINIKVDKNDVINQINISTEEILIAGNRIHLTGQTIIDDAIITSAMIKDLTADKITAGTINANEVNLINLRAENIVGKNTQFVSSSWNDVSNYVSIHSEGVEAGSGDNKMWLNWRGIEAINRGVSVGNIGTNRIKNHDDVLGLVFDLEEVPAGFGKYMSWANAENNNGVYTQKFAWYDWIGAQKTGLPYGLVASSPLTMQDAFQYAGASIRFTRMSISGQNGLALHMDNGAGFWWGDNGDVGILGTGAAVNLRGCLFPTEFTSDGRVSRYYRF